MVMASIWDNDGAPVDTEELSFRATGDVLSEVGIDLSRDLFIHIFPEQGQSAFI